MAFVQQVSGMQQQIVHGRCLIYRQWQGSLCVNKGLHFAFSSRRGIYHALGKDFNAAVKNTHQGQRLLLGLLLGGIFIIVMASFSCSFI